MTGSAESSASWRAPIVWTATALAGLATCGVIVWLAGLLPAETCASPSVGSPLAAFQAADTAEDIASVFGAEASACRDALRASMDKVNQADLWAYIPASALLLLGFLVGSRRPGWGLVFWAGLLALAVTVAGDLAETSAQLSITSQLAGGGATQTAVNEGSLTLLSIGNTAKVLGYPFVILAMALLWIGRGVLATVFAVVLLGSVLPRLIAVAAPMPPSVVQYAWLLGVFALTVASICLAVAQWIPKKGPAPQP